MILPIEFADKMKLILGDEYDSFLKSYEEPRQFGLRVNTAKISTEEFIRIAPFHLRPIPWIPNGFYYEAEDLPSQHPFYYAGLYYLQEPSAMSPASRLPVMPGERVLDLCAAPGGKATELGAKLNGSGLLVANDISASRARALLKNVEVFGIPNSFLINEVPGNISGEFEGFFDKILVDAPCSGEGMFRKDPAVAKVWTKDKPADCAKLQREIVRQAIRMLCPGGMMLYSTCTFSPEENEQIIAYILQNHDTMELVEMEPYEGFGAGRPELADGNEDLRKCIRIWPHIMSGEGHFMALLKKQGEHVETGEKPSKKPIPKQERALLDEFFKDVSMDLDQNRMEVRKGQVYYLTEHLGERRGITFLRNGLYLGELKKNRFEPSQAFAMALKKQEYASVLDLDFHDSRVNRYLKGETISVDDVPAKHKKGWQLVCVNGYPLGWGKLSGGVLKNKYLASWRIRG